MANPVAVEAIKAASAAYPKPHGFKPAYGTAGFRANASLLASTVFRCGMLAAARCLLAGAHTGIMITASHNPAADNGVKMIEPDGGMLPQDVEPFATELANADDDEQIAALVLDRLAGTAVPGALPQPGGAGGHMVLVAHDTRPSAPELLAAAVAGIQALNVRAHSYGPLTTPQLHFLVAAANSGPSVRTTPAAAAALPQLHQYYDTLIGAFLELSGGTGAVPGSLVVDCANGVGAARLEPLVGPLEKAGIRLVLRNTGSGQLNHCCGADYVQKERVPPADFQGVEADARCCSIDGDADRLVYFSPPPAPGAEQHGGEDAPTATTSGSVSLLDGDKIAILAAVFTRELLDKLPPGLAEGLKVCCVQTAYANGASTAYIERTLSLPVVCTPTGVKHLHVAAHEADIGIYFESNGHGTVLFSADLVRRLKQAADEVPAARELLLLSQVINQTVGDAISGILLVELILRRKGWTLSEWQALYTDLPSRQAKLKVADRYVITTADAERRCVTPPGLQGAIDRVVHEYPQGRAFARPSGTEDAVRIYAEAASQHDADALARRVGQLVYDMAGGVDGL